VHPGLQSASPADPSITLRKIWAPQGRKGSAKAGVCASPEKKHADPWSVGCAGSPGSLPGSRTCRVGRRLRHPGRWVNGSGQKARRLFSKARERNDSRQQTNKRIAAARQRHHPGPDRAELGELGPNSSRAKPGTRLPCRLGDDEVTPLIRVFEARPGVWFFFHASRPPEAKYFTPEDPDAAANPVAPGRCLEANRRFTAPSPMGPEWGRVFFRTRWWGGLDWPSHPVIGGEKSSALGGVAAIGSR